MNNIVLATKFIELFAGKSVVIERMSQNSVGSKGTYTEEARGVCHTFHETGKDGYIEVELVDTKQRYCFFPENMTGVSAEGRVNPVIELRRKIFLT